MSDQYASGADLAPETDYYPDLMIGPSMKPATLRVTAGGVVTTYEIDRWD